MSSEFIYFGVGELGALHYVTDCSVGEEEVVDLEEEVGVEVDIGEEDGAESDCGCHHNG